MRRPTKKNPTQLNLVKFVSSIFDPFTIIMPLTLPLRKSVQFAWIILPQWDKPLNLESLTDFNEWFDERNHFRFNTAEIKFIIAKA